MKIVSGHSQKSPGPKLLLEPNSHISRAMVQENPKAPFFIYG
jgi:hypothetical protein